MFSKKSIRHKFTLQLVSASAILIVVFSIILYNYIKITIFEDLNNSLAKELKLLAISKGDYQDLTFKIKNLNMHDITVQLVDKPELRRNMFEHSREGENYYLSLYYPYKLETSTYVKLTKDITSTNKLLDKILFDIFIINLSAIFLILFYALLLSRMLLLPIKILNHNLSKMDEDFLRRIDTASLPVEFLPLGKSINKLINRIQTFVKYQKELFIGTAHELKTPLAVMKARNEVTLIKKRDEERYIESLKNNNKTIDEMNKMIGAILEIGRQEGAQFEEPISIDLIEFLTEKVDDFRILSHQVGIKIEANLSPTKYMITTQPTLLIHILQNFIQNAIKFTKEKSTIEVVSFADEAGITIKIIDAGEGIDDDKDYFAPFKRYGSKSGAGLGLFLAKGAADAIGATISLKNRDAGQSGSVATLFIPTRTKVDHR